MNAIAPWPLAQRALALGRRGPMARTVASTPRLKAAQGRGPRRLQEMAMAPVRSRPTQIQILEPSVPRPRDLLPPLWTAARWSAIWDWAKAAVVSTVTVVRLRGKLPGGWRPRAWVETVAEPLYVRLQRAVAAADKAQLREIATAGMAGELQAQMRQQEAALTQLAPGAACEWSYSGAAARPRVVLVRMASVLGMDESFIAQITVQHESEQAVRIVSGGSLLQQVVEPVREHVIYEAWLSPGCEPEWKVAGRLSLSGPR